MRSMPHRTALVLTMVVAASCGDAGVMAPDDPAFSRSQEVGAASQAASELGRNFNAPLDGGQEVPSVDTEATGVAQFRLSADGTELSYKLIVANIENVTMAHIHLAAAGVNGPVVVWLYPPAPPAELIPGRFSGILAEGVITDANLVGPLTGATLEDLLDAIRAGETYVNVHTLQFPPGEIRGQIMAPRQTGGLGRLLR